MTIPSLVFLPTVDSLSHHFSPNETVHSNVVARRRSFPNHVKLAAHAISPKHFELVYFQFGIFVVMYLWSHCGQVQQM